MATVVCRVKPSIHAAYQADDHIPVNVTALYARLARVPTTAGRELVRHTADRLGPVIRAMGGAVPDPLPGYRVKVLDGNHLGKTQRRLKPLRDVVAGPLPGQTLVVLDPALGLAIDVVPCEDGHAQERSLLDPILETVADRDVWVADRNFCTTGFLFGIAGRKGFFVIRRHAATLSWERESEWVPAGRTDTGTLDRADDLADGTGRGGAGGPAGAADVGPPDPGRGRGDRGADQPAGRGGDRIGGGRAVPGSVVGRGAVPAADDGAQVRGEHAGYPPAALFGFCVALAAGNVYAAVTRRQLPRVAVRDLPQRVSRLPHPPGYSPAPGR